MDKNKDGTLSKIEFENVMRTLGEEIESSELDNVF